MCDDATLQIAMGHDMAGFLLRFLPCAARIGRAKNPVGRAVFRLTPRGEHHGVTRSPLPFAAAAGRTPRRFVPFHCTGP
jgi:hypothetical protein